MITKIFIIGAVTGMSDEWKANFAKLKEKILTDFPNITVYTPDDIDIYCEELYKSGIASEKVLHKIGEFNANLVKSADIIICECSHGSLGVGIELGIAHECKIPVFAYAKTGATVSGSVPAFFGEVKYYDKLDEITTDLKKRIQ